MTTRLPHESVPTTGVGVISDLKRARRESGASMAELRDFIGQMRGRSPQEVLGMVSASELIRGIAIATVSTVLLIGVFTVGPYLFLEKPAAKQAASKDAPATAAPANSAKTPVVAASADKSDEESKPAASADASAAAKALNLDEVKTADPNINPLDKDLDKLLDGKE